MCTVPHDPPRVLPPAVRPDEWRGQGADGGMRARGKARPGDARHVGASAGRVGEVGLDWVEG